MSLLLILISVGAFVIGQLVLKHAMVSAAAIGLSQPKSIRYLAAGIALMAVSFFLTVGLLAHFDLSYLYPFQGLSVIFISFAAAFFLKEKLTTPLVVGSLLITAGIVIVALS